MKPRLVGVDFETLAILQRPTYPPTPVGVAVFPEGGRSEYFAWGHPTGNNATHAQGRERVQDLWRGAARGSIELVFFNAKFDLDVAETHLGVTPLGWEHWHDAMFLAFLVDPYEMNLGLKPLAVKYLAAKHAGQSKLREWLVAHVPEARRAKTKWGAYIAQAPGTLVDRYARDDVQETIALFKLLRRKAIGELGMQIPYDRERRLLHPLLRAERRGVRIDAPRLQRDVASWEKSVEYIDGWLRKRLRAPSLDIDANVELAEALAKADVVKHWVYTEPSKTFPGGQRSVAMEALEIGIEDQELLDTFRYRTKLVSGLRTFGRPWLAMADASGDGRIFTTWNQVRQAFNDRRNIGARTGRMSSTPNLQNIAKTPGVLAWNKKNWRFEKHSADESGRPAPLLLAKATQKSVAPLPDLRGYVIPYAKGHELNVRDFNQQELRILAHYEGKHIMQAYIDNPRLDQHTYAQQMINSKLGTAYPRAAVKQIGFGIIYAMGLALLADKIGSTIDMARDVRIAYRQIFTGIEELEKKLRRYGRKGTPIVTHGGRVYFPEEAKVVKGELRTWEYKLINTLIQGTAGDDMKESIIAYDADQSTDGAWHLTVHDELVTSAPKKQRDAEQTRIRVAMDAMKFDVPMLSDGKYGPTWSSRDLMKYKEAA